jgi:hypothetical protein
LVCARGMMLWLATKEAKGSTQFSAALQPEAL